MNSYEEKCMSCKHNYKVAGDEPKCSMMCANHSDYEPLTNYDYIMRCDIEDLADELLNWFSDGYYFGYVSVDWNKKYNEILDWLKQEGDKF